MEEPLIRTLEEQIAEKIKITARGLVFMMRSMWTGGSVSSRKKKEWSF